jgi:c-di-GMP-binding flagellar brake protein YcgR
MDEATKVIDDTAQIAMQLCRLQDGHRLLVGRTCAGNAAFTTMILNIDLTRGLFLLDTPKLADFPMQSAQVLELQAYMDGPWMRFTAEIQGVIESQSCSYYHMRFPERIEYTQRRDNYRAHVALSFYSQLLMRLEDAAVAEDMQADLLDLSEGGIGAWLPDEKTILLAANAVYPARMQLLQTQLEMKIEIRYVTRAIRGSGLRLGARFINLDPASRVIIRRQIIDLQRQMLRTRPKA